MLPRSYAHLVDETAAALVPLDAAQVQEQCRQSGSHLNLLMRSWRVYNRAYERSKDYGFVGVGCISFAEARLAKFAERVK